MCGSVYTQNPLEPYFVDNIKFSPVVQMNLIVDTNQDLSLASWYQWGLSLEPCLFIFCVCVPFHGAHSPTLRCSLPSILH